MCQGRNGLEFGEDPDLDTVYFFLSDSSPLSDWAKNDIQHNISNSYGRIWTKLGGQIGCLIRTN